MADIALSAHSMFKSKALEITILSLKRLKVTDQGMDVVKPVLKIIWAYEKVKALEI